MFYNTVHNIRAGYLVQRIKMTDTVVDSEGKTSVTTKHLVEVFMPKGERLPGADQHFGYYPLRGASRRTITKEFEIGIGSVPGHAAPGDWPFKGQIFKLLQGYQAEPGLYEKVQCKQPKRWKICLSFDAHGNYTFQIPEFGVDVAVQVPADAGPPAPPALGKNLVLQEGKGLKGLVVGKSTLAGVKRVLGEPRKVTAHAHAKNYWYEGFTCNVNGAGTLNTIFSEPGFAGQTAKGIRHGTGIGALEKAYGKSGRVANSITYYQHGISFHLDAEQRVSKIVVSKPR